MRNLALLISVLVVGQLQAADRPNIVWISVEDISSHLGCYGDPNATTPNLDAFAKESVRYTQAFTVHGVCAPCRTGIITGMYPIGIGANHMRSKATLPDHIKCFPEYLRKAGYYCTNNSKTDYNFHWKESDVWDESSGKAHWKNRPDKDQPFFAVFNLTSCHESRIWPANWKKLVKDLPPGDLHDPTRIKIPALYPDTAAVREAHARLLDVIMVTDTTIGKRLKEIDDADLKNETIVIFWSDHGNGFPRAKRWIYDSGTLVPMMARIPEKFRADGQAQPGSVDNQLINLIDLGPTVLNLAGVPVPEHMFGQPFLGPDLPEPRQYIHGARDRVDERFDMVRSVRDKRFRYVRNYNPWRAALQHILYAETSVVRQEMRRKDADGTLQPESAQFLHAPRAAEELYDLEADPWELNNLAADPTYAAERKRLQKACVEWQTRVRDAHLIPESLLAAEEKEAESRWDVLHSENGSDRLNALLQVAQTASSPVAADETALVESASHDDPAVRWWAIQGLANLKAASSESAKAIDAAAEDKSSAVRIAAGRALHVTGQTDRAVALLTEELADKSDFVRHAALSEIDEIGAAASSAKAAIQQMTGKNRKGYIANVAKHALQQFDAAP